MGYEIVGTTIYLTRGDTLYAEIGIQRKSGEAYIPAAGDKIRFALKSQRMKPGDTDFADSKPLILKPIANDTLLLHLEPEDTKRLPFGTYAYDVEIEFENGDVDTFIEDAVFKLTREVD